MTEYLTVLRLLHIVFGVFWAGTAIMLHFFLFPAIKNMGPDGAKAMQAIMTTRKFPLVMTVSGGITIFAGLALMDHFSMHFTAGWFTTSHGFCLGLGAAFGFGALLIGLFMNKPAADRIAAIGATVAASGMPPTAEQSETMMRLREG